MWIAIGLIVCVVAYVVVKSALANMRTRTLEASFATLDAATVSRIFEESCAVVVRHLTGPGSGISSKTAMMHLERALTAANRSNQIEGREYGPAFRLKMRPELLKALTEEADREARLRGLI